MKRLLTRRLVPTVLLCLGFLALVAAAWVLSSPSGRLNVALRDTGQSQGAAVTTFSTVNSMHEYTVPADVYSISVKVVGGGAGGGTGRGPLNGNCDCWTGQPGGAGQVVTTLRQVTPGQKFELITVGAGGLGAPQLYFQYCGAGSYAWLGDAGESSSFDGTVAAGGNPSGTPGPTLTASNWVYSYPGGTNGSGYGSGGASASCDNAAPNGQPGAVIITTIAELSFLPATTPVNNGTSQTLSWTATGVSSCSLSHAANGGAAQTVVGDAKLTTSYSTGALTYLQNRYTLSCVDLNGNPQSIFTDVYVNPPTLALSLCNLANYCNTVATDANPGQTLSATWSAASVNSGSCTLKTGGVTVSSASSGTNVTTPAVAATTSYVLDCLYNGLVHTTKTVSVPVGPPCTSAGANPLSGWGWSENYGWLSLDCATAYAASPRAVQHNYGLNLNSDNTVNGYAWNDTLGWVKFGGLSGFPTGGGTTASNATLVGDDIVGWARACSGTVNGDCSSMTSAPGFDGWLALSGSNFGVVLGPSLGCTGSECYDATHASSWAFGSSPWGWVSFNFTAGPCQNTPNYSCTTETQSSYTDQWCSPAVESCVFGCTAASGQCLQPANGGCISLNAATCTPARKTLTVRKGGSTMLFWDVRGVSTCQVTANGTVISATATAGNQSVGPINQKTDYTVSCDDGFTDKATVNLVPSFIEI